MTQCSATRTIPKTLLLLAALTVTTVAVGAVTSTPILREESTRIRNPSSDVGKAAEQRGDIEEAFRLTVAEAADCDATDSGADAFNCHAVLREVVYYAEQREQPQTAISYARRALRLSEGTYGTLSTITLSDYELLAKLLAESARFAEAEQYYIAAIESRLAIDAQEGLPPFFDLADLYQRLANNLTAQSKPDQASEILKKSMQVFYDRSDRYDRITLELISHTHNLDKQNRSSDANYYLDEALRLTERLIDPPDNLSNIMIPVYNALTSRLDARKRFKEAERFYGLWLMLESMFYQPDQPVPVETFKRYVWNLQQQGRDKDAEDLQKKIEIELEKRGLKVIDWSPRYTDQIFRVRGDCKRI